MKKTKAEKGITLIALIITIIVLLILAMVTIRAVQDNGIIGYATKAKDETEKAQQEEDEALGLYEEKLAYSDRQKNAEVWTGSVAESFAEGAGTEADPYKIRNGEELALLAQKVNAGEQQEGTVYTIVNDINLNNINWTPIGGNQPLPNKEAVVDITNVKEQFKGKIRGDGKIIFNLKVDLTQAACVGLFGILGEGGEIDEIVIGSGDIKGGQEVGGIVGRTCGTIKSCENNAAVTAVDDASIWGTGQYTGGIAGYGYGTIENCINRGNILGRDECNQTGRGKVVGGILGGFVEYEPAGKMSTISGCINEGMVVTQYQLVGGIAGLFGHGTIENCRNTGAVSAPNAFNNNNTGAGGIVGWAKANGPTSIQNCTNSGPVSSISRARRHNW